MKLFDVRIGETFQMNGQTYKLEKLEGSSVTVRENKSGKRFIHGAENLRRILMTMGYALILK